MADNAETKQQVSFKDTLNLPHTDFPIRANTKEEDPAMIERWIKEKLFEHSFTHNEGKKRFILHDGPPYANGHIHIGHAYNKILKDIVAKSKRMFGLQVPVTPGWDCHGLPIEFKVSQENKGLSPSELKKACRAYAQEWINVQREEFKKLGVLMDWDHPYLTMNYSYEAYTLKAFAQFVEEKYIERKNKTVPWCIHCETVLATAEIEYEDRKDPSIYVMFPLEQKIIDQQLPFLKDTQVSLLIWTTTPWTLPLNRAVLARPGIMYEILLINGKQVLVAQPLADKVTALMGVEKQVLGHIMSDQLVAGGAHAHHPFIAGLTVPLILDESVLLDEGTAFVHCAPGAGPQDYDVAIKNNLDIFSPVSTNGHYMPGIMPAELEGMSLADAQGWVIKKLTEQDKLLFKTSIKHPYPHCWRCHNPLIFRATKQWFVDLEKHNIKKDTLLTIQENVAMYPAASKNRLMATIDGRLEWCLSRQRVWGTPIPALLCNNCDHTYISKELIERVAQGVEKAGIEYWDTVTIEDLVGKDVCPSCKKYDWKKEQDILDVWFDSGVSNYVVLKHNPALQFPADIYVEGKDQHRGWFQSSLLSSMALNHEACMRSIITHGFTVDANGRKMSKSLGNVVSPQEMIEKLGTDGLRCWAAGIDYAGDAVVSDVLMRNVQEVFRKVRNTCRFLLSNIYDFDIDRDVVPLEELRLIDQHAMLELFEINAQILSHYENYEFTKVFHGLGDYCTVNLSSFYLDIIKDRLYVESSTGHERRSAQTACWYILDTLTKLMAPIMSFTAEQISDHYQKNKQQSIHLQDFSSLPSFGKFLASKDKQWEPELGDDLASLSQIASQIDTMKFIAEHRACQQLLQDIRSALLKAIEAQREKGLIKHPLEVRLTLHIDLPSPRKLVWEHFLKDLKASGQDLVSFLKEFMIISQVNIVDHKKDLEPTMVEGLYVRIDHAEGDKCPRCWNWEKSFNEYKLCRRCQEVLGQVV